MPTEEEDPYRIGGYNVERPPLGIREKECTCEQRSKQKEERNYRKQSRDFLSACHIRCGMGGKNGCRYESDIGVGHILCRHKGIKKERTETPYHKKKIK